MGFKHPFFLLACTLLLVGCQGFGCDTRIDLKAWQISNLPDLPEAIPSHSSALSPKREKKKPVLKQPPHYRLAKNFPVLPGIKYMQYEAENKNPTQTLRIIHILPRAFGHLQVLFSDHWDHPLSVHTVSSRRNIIAAMTWSFMGRIPGADMIGMRCKRQGRSCKKGAYTNSEKRTGQNTHHRWTAALKKNQNQFRFFKGGLGSDSNQWYRLAMGGGVMLFDRSHDVLSYQSVGHSDYAKHYKNPHNNERKIIRAGQAGELYRKAPRSAMGLLPDGSFIYLNLGEGKFHFEGGISPFGLAQLMKALGCSSALMFDGGGAPVMQIKDRRGRVLVKTQPEHRAGSNYHYNYAFLTLTSTPSHL